MSDEYIDEDAIICVAEFDFYTEVLTWSTNNDELATALVDEAWAYYQDNAISEARFNHCKELKGERYLSEIELDGPTVRVTIYDDWRYLSQDELDLMDRLRRMTHRQMAVTYCYAPAGHPYFIIGTKLNQAFNEKWEALGGMTAALSKSIEPLTS